MQIWRGVDAVAQGLRTVVTIGIFDGVHRGHQQLIGAVCDRAKAHRAQAVALTFDPHPAQVHSPERGVELIMALPDRLNALASLGLDATLVVPYNLELAALSPEEFVSQYFVELLGAVEVVVGSDVRFGVGNSGNITTLRELGQRYGFAVTEISDVTDPDGLRWSSTRTRELLSQGRVAEAAHVLGRPHRLRGRVEHGFKRGRELGFPTANLATVGIGVVPADGVYAGWLVRHVPGTQAYENLPAAISVGTNPQFGGVRRTVEAHVLGRADLDLYGEEVAIDFVRMIRPMATFASVDELLAQMDEDLLRCAGILGVPPAGRVDPKDVTAGR